MNEDSRNSLNEIFIDPELKDQLSKLVLERVSVMPDTLCMSVGGTELTKKDVIRHVQDGDEIGKQVMEMELGFLRDLASGAIYSVE